MIGSNQQDLSFEFEKYNNNYYLKSVSIRDLYGLSSQKISKEQKENEAGQEKKENINNNNS